MVLHLIIFLLVCKLSTQTFSLPLLKLFYHKAILRLIFPYLSRYQMTKLLLFSKVHENRYTMRKVISVNKYKESRMFSRTNTNTLAQEKYFQDLGQKHQGLLIDNATIVHSKSNAKLVEQNIWLIRYKLIAMLKQMRN